MGITRKSNPFDINGKRFDKRSEVETVKDLIRDLSTQTNISEDIIQELPIMEMIGVLSQREASYIILHYLHKQSIVDVSREMGVNPGYVEHILARGKNRLGEYLIKQRKENK